METLINLGRIVPFVILLIALIPSVFIFFKSKKIERIIHSHFLDLFHIFFSYVIFCLYTPIVMSIFFYEFITVNFIVGINEKFDIIITIVGSLLLISYLVIIGLIYSKNLSKTFPLSKIKTTECKKKSPPQKKTISTQKKMIFTLIIVVFNLIPYSFFVSLCFYFLDKQIFRESFSLFLVVSICYQPLFILFFKDWRRILSTIIVSTIFLDNGNKIENVVISHKTFSNFLVAKYLLEDNNQESILISKSKILYITSIESSVYSLKGESVQNLKWLNSKINGIKSLKDTNSP